jgi:uncharacterized protein (DUF934 family)
MNSPGIRFIDTNHDSWLGPAEEGEALSPVDGRLLTLAQWQTVRGAWPQGPDTGVMLPNDADLEALAPDLERFALVVLQFPKWTDGRAYSQARLLRRRYRFAGELRAAGEVLVDMLPLLLRTGFDAAVLRADQDVEAARRALSFFPDHYQGDAVRAWPRYARLASEHVLP